MSAYEIKCWWGTHESMLRSSLNACGRHRIEDYAKCVAGPTQRENGAKLGVRTSYCQITSSKNDRLKDSVVIRQLKGTNSTCMRDCLLVYNQMHQMLPQSNSNTVLIILLQEGGRVFFKGKQKMVLKSVLLYCKMIKDWNWGVWLLFPAGTLSGASSQV